ncbi:urea carboxylase [Chamaesiphon minutus]|uniref:Urea carboxylase n=1 Tax=Chamaesiphon minutus (strain ATCC 27169 / PCC 6605) TaxID=1173020 RepID=K9UMN7_CHAP6|nr:urea carboxylase [Chamaesiphon minutus]AFY95459.1 urea carboxylase [Chamaesiphon minutus PCC 6605]
MIDRILIANRGEIACRIIRTLDRLNIQSIALYSEIDRHAPHVSTATESFCIGKATAAESYLQADRILQIARENRVRAIHPGYGFLSENADFATACETAQIAFIGPTPAQLVQFGLKHTARSIAAENGIPMLTGSELLESLAQAETIAAQIGYPVMLKSTAGGGGIGMEICRDSSSLAAAFDRVDRLSRQNFSQGGIFLERYLSRARHIEVQIFGDGKGNVVALGERDCSLQRRNQKVVEETPAPGIDDSLRSQLYAAAVKLGKSVNYRSAGTVEFIVDADSQEFYFLEVNTRLQVEHGVTELVGNIDLVEWMVRLAGGEDLDLANYQYQPQGHAIQVRIYAEDPHHNFQPSAGLLTAVNFPEHVRVDGWIEAGTEVTPYYDPLLAKVLVHDRDRDAAISQLQTTLDNTTIAGIETNLDYLICAISQPEYQAGNVHTRFLNTLNYQPHSIDILDPGIQTTIQDYPGRIGYWDVGVPPSGPIDHLAFRLGNRLLNNAPDAAGLECTVSGPKIRFNCDRAICLTGAQMKATLDGAPMPWWTVIQVKTGSVLKLGSIDGAGYRTYLTVAGGLDVPNYLGSKSTFTLGQFGGHGGRTLRTGDVLHFNDAPVNSPLVSLAPDLIPLYPDRWEIGVTYGPHGAPDFFTSADIEMFFATDWEIHHNSARTGIRLIGPKPEWARTDGGEAGLHPSNIHDNAYAIGTVDFTGDMPIILAHDGPSLGGFVCPVTIVQAELWKIGQLKPGDKVRFQPMSIERAHALELVQDREIETLAPEARDYPPEQVLLVDKLPASDSLTTYRRSGDKYLLIEYGELVLDLNLRFQIYALMEYLQANPIEGIIDLTPGIRSLQIHYDSRILAERELLDLLRIARANLPSVDRLTVPTRIVHLPLSWNDDSTQLAIDKYIQSVRDDAPWCPSNIEFIRRINGLDSIESVREIVFAASYLVLGLGDVYLGAPVATPIDPRHRLVTTKYNPARTWTPENAVGIGGAYMCIYGMEGPGGYQFVGRTVPIWNRYRQTADFTKPWLLRFFDQIRYFPVSPAELLQYREDLIYGRVKLKIESTTFSLSEYQKFLVENTESIATFRTKQQAAFQAERSAWEAAGEFTRQSTEPELAPPSTLELPANCVPISAYLTANVWQVLVKPGDLVNPGDTLIILEAMKMEMTIEAEESGSIEAVYCHPGKMVSSGQVLIALKTN